MANKKEPSGTCTGTASNSPSHKSCGTDAAFSLKGGKEPTDTCTGAASNSPSHKMFGRRNCLTLPEAGKGPTCIGAASVSLS
ncbi:MAG TPA: hypothetical protein ENJ95_05190 [Bacteroidetes bacterium]|nr:hypothetical protein [Bacteroidota bacterium]